MSDYKGTYTTNLNLSKDSEDDFYNVGRVNDNSDKIDEFAGDITEQLNSLTNDSYPIVEATGVNNYIGASARIKSVGKGTRCTLFVETPSTSNCSLDLNNSGAVAIKDSNGNVVTNLKANIPYNLCHNGSDFILQGKGGGGNATAEQILEGATATVDSGQITGTMARRMIINITDTIDADNIPNYPFGIRQSENTGTIGPYSEIVVTLPKTEYITDKFAFWLQGLHSQYIKSGVKVGGESGIVGTFTSDATAQAGHILSGQSAYVNGDKVIGTMIDRGAKTATLNPSESYNIPAGYHNGSGRITANSLASQTPANATAAQILAGYSAWVNGVLLNGGMVNRGAVSATLNAGGSYTIPAGYHNGSGKITAKSLASQNAKQFASGTITISSGTLSFKKISGSSASSRYADITFSGNFVPKYGYITEASNAYWQCCFYAYNNDTLIFNTNNTYDDLRYYASENTNIILDAGRVRVPVQNWASVTMTYVLFG